LAFKSSCGNVKPSGGRLRACFESNIGKLSGPCGDKLARAASVAQVCEAKFRKFCGGAKRAVDLPGCMKPRLAEVTKPCMDALATAGVAAARKR